MNRSAHRYGTGGGPCGKGTVGVASLGEGRVVSRVWKIWEDVYPPFRCGVVTVMRVYVVVSAEASRIVVSLQVTTLRSVHSQRR
jgi:hypothetical protein